MTPHFNQLAGPTIIIHCGYYFEILLTGLMRFLVSFEQSEDLRSLGQQSAGDQWYQAL